MTDLATQLNTANRKQSFPVEKSNKSRLSGKLRYWWCWFVAGSLLLFVATPALAFLWLINRRMWLYPLAKWGAKTWLDACGATVKVRGTENLDKERSYVFVSNHRSYLDTATLFFYTGKKMGLVAKKELLKAPVLGQGMSFVNIIAIDRTNPERALRSMKRAREVIADGYSFGVFAEGTRAMPGELLPFKKGAFYLALQTGSAIVPVAIKNTDCMMGKKTGVAYPGVIEMVLLPPIETAGKGSGHVTDLLLKTRELVAKELLQSTREGSVTT
ncbi:MAG TPA: lysophospholipid acyltransferase family protein [Pyrinomonadaceae bacterium]|nr:lysophospholipid acyltransferase family protein [Pyrinomonadaceae bacterium]